MKPTTYDFSGWVTKNNILCSDGRTILKDAFAPQNDSYVPLVWGHDHDNPENTLGKVYLENRDEGVYGYGIFNNSRRAKASKEAVNHGDVTSMSIWANHLTQDSNKNVSHGKIREVSLVLAAANPGAKIDFLMAHGDEDEDETQAIIYGPEDTLDIYHEDDHGNGKNNTEDNMPDNETKKNAEDMTLEDAFNDVMDKLSEEEQNVIYAVLSVAAGANVAKQEDNSDEENTLRHNDEGEENNMKTNAFENNGTAKVEKSIGLDALSHDDMSAIFAEAKRCGSLKEAVRTANSYLQHSVVDTITVPEHTDHILYPDPKAVPGMPVTIDRRQEWVKIVMNAINRVPFGRVKMFGFDITPDEARAKGYVTGTKKTEEVITAIRRSTDPTTVYKLQKIDRDQLLDIADFNIVGYLHSEMEGKLDEELARAFLFGDGRSSSSPDKIPETNIRPIWTDNDVFTVVKRLVYTASDTKTTKLKKFLEACIKCRKDYRGKGNPTAFVSEDLLSDLLVMEDGIGHRLYPDEASLAKAMRVSQVVPVPVMEGLKRTVSVEGTDTDYDLLSIIVNLGDYTVGNYRGGEKTMFEDFDIDYNAQKYLIETRKSGALTTPFSAVVIEAPSETEEEG